ncbi:MAG: ribosome-binding factor A [Deltaproteobacteria bacterium]|nr:ribosome-binding factor A [Deltaproteobacteria bacterium]
MGDLLVELISELLRREIRDPRVAAVALTGAKVSKDLKHARIYFNLLGDSGSRNEALAGLNSATGFIRSKVGKQLNLEDQAQRIDDLLKLVKPEQ